MADLRQEFAEQFCFTMLRAGAVYEGDYLLGTSIARPLIAREQVVSPTRPGRTRWATAPPARATTRCGLS